MKDVVIKINQEANKPVLSALILKDDFLPRRAVAQKLLKGEKKVALSKLLTVD